MLPFADYYISSPSMSDTNITSKKRRKKKKEPVTVDGGKEDNLLMVKAAAWAWYQRKESKPIMREFGLTRSVTTSRPSRYKIEATKNMILSENRVLAENRFSKSSIWYANYSFRGDQETQYSHLLDSYEIKNRLNYEDHSLFEKRIGYENDMKRHNDNKSFNGFMKRVSKRMSMMGPRLKVCGRSDDVELQASQASRKTVKVAAAAEALLRSAASSKTQSGSFQNFNQKEK